MAMQLKQMTREEFVRKILDGERDFSEIELPEGTDLSGYDGFKDMLVYLKKQQLSEDPIIINDSKFRYVKAAHLYLPYIEGRKVDLVGAYLVEADLERADLERADLVEANLVEANLERADLVEADLEGVDLEGANLKRAYLERANLVEANLERADLVEADLERVDLVEANLERANLKNVRNLEYALNLHLADFVETRVSAKEKAIIEKALKKRILFVVEE